MTVYQKYRKTVGLNLRGPVLGQRFVWSKCHGKRVTIYVPEMYCHVYCPMLTASEYDGNQTEQVACAFRRICPSRGDNLTTLKKRGNQACLCP